MMMTILGPPVLDSHLPVVSIFAIIDNRRQRTQREKGVIAAQATFEHVYDLLIGIKPAGPLLPVVARGLQFVADLFSA
jgi:hypothetical protein